VDCFAARCLMSTAFCAAPIQASCRSLPATMRIARAQTYPTRPVRLIVGFVSGSPPDIEVNENWGRALLASSGATIALSSFPTTRLEVDAGRRQDALGNGARGCARRRHRDATRRDRQGQSWGRDRELSVLRSQHGPNTNVVLRARP